MGKSIKYDNQKKRGRPATGVTPMTGVRFAEDQARAIEAWAKRQQDKPTKAEAIRRLVDLGLKAKPAKR